MAALSAQLLLLLTAPCALASRVASNLHVGSVRSSTAALTEGEMRSTERTFARFAAAFPEMYSAETSCPYGDVDESKRGGTSSYNCHWKAEGMGKTCPELQQARLKPGRNFIASNYKDFMDKALNDFPLKPLFDKTGKVRGDETYERLVQLHIQGLLHEDVKFLEDKLLLKQKAQSLGVPATTSYFGSHKKAWESGERATFIETLKGFCKASGGVDEFMIKATHLSWSAGMKIVRNWKQVCEGGSLQEEVEKLTTYVESDILGQLARETDAHLRDILEPGVSVEELFRSGGASMIPLEAKVQVVWGKAYLVWIVGQDNRGCHSQSGAWHVYPDKSGWDLKGIISSGGSDEVNERITSSSAWSTLLTKAEDFARGVGADLMRVDFFIGFPEDPNKELVIKLNECESVSGHPYWHERDGIADVWRDGYVLSDRMAMTSEQWEATFETTQRLRDEVTLDTH